MKSNIFLRIYVPKMLQKTDVRYHLVSGDFPLHRVKARHEVLLQTPTYYPVTLLFSDKEPVHGNAEARKEGSIYYPDKIAVVLPICRRNTYNTRHCLQKRKDRCCSCPSSGLPGEQKVLPVGR